jgi:hypothetical protein
MQLRTLNYLEIIMKRHLRKIIVCSIVSLFIALIWFNPNRNQQNGLYFMLANISNFYFKNLSRLTNSKFSATIDIRYTLSSCVSEMFIACTSINRISIMLTSCSVSFIKEQFERRFPFDLIYHI